MWISRPWSHHLHPLPLPHSLLPLPLLSPSSLYLLLTSLPHPHLLLPPHPLPLHCQPSGNQLHPPENQHRPPESQLHPPGSQPHPRKNQHRPPESQPHPQRSCHPHPLKSAGKGIHVGAGGLSLGQWFVCLGPNLKIHSTILWYVHGRILFRAVCSMPRLANHPAATIFLHPSTAQVSKIDTWNSV